MGRTETLSIDSLPAYGDSRNPGAKAMFWEPLTAAPWYRSLTVAGAGGPDAVVDPAGPRRLRPGLISDMIVVCRSGVGPEDAGATSTSLAS